MCGKTRTRAPRRRIARTMFFFRPRSTIPIRGPVSPAASKSVIAAGETCADEVLVLPARDGRGGRARPCPGRSSPGAVTMPRRQPLARRWRASARVSTPGDRRDVVVAQQRRELAGVVEDGRGGVRDDERPQPGPDRLVVVGQAAVVADERIGHDDDLAGIGGVGADLLVAGLAGVDDEVAARGDRCAERDARGRPCRPRAPAAPARGHRSGDRRSRSSAAAVGRSPACRYNEPTGLMGAVGEDVRGHSPSFAGLTGPVRQPHRTGHERTPSG